MEPRNYGWEEINSILCKDKRTVFILEEFLVACG